MLESAEKEAAELDKLLQHVEPIIKPRAPKKVALGCTAKLKNGERTVHYTIVCSLEIDLQNNRISEDSVLGKAVLGKKVGDVFSITTPSGDLFSYEVISIN
jgi:transcription elongation factor GreA